MPRTTWRKSTYSDQQNGCVEVDLSAENARIRDTKLVDSPIINFTPDQWTAWLDEVATDQLTGANGAVTVDLALGTWIVRGVPGGPELTFDAAEWHAFRTGVRAGEFAHGGCRTRYIASLVAAHTDLSRSPTG